MPNHRFIQFYQPNLRGVLSEVLGTDGVLPIDGRLSTASAILAGARQARRLAAVKPDISALRLFWYGKRGYSDARPITGIIPINKGPANA